jgi:gliding motility-associated-like protein
MKNIVLSTLILIGSFNSIAQSNSGQLNIALNDGQPQTDGQQKNPAIGFQKIKQISHSMSPCDNWLYLPALYSYMSVGQLNVMGNQITVEAMINRTAPYTGGPLYAGDIVSKHNDPTDVNYLLRPNSAEITTTNGYFRTPDVCEIKLNKTYHVAMVYDGSSLKFYRNGYLMSQIPASGDLFQNGWDTRIGLYELQAYNTNFIGYINEVRIWNVARSQLELQTYMNTTLPTPTLQIGLLAYYNFSSLSNLQGNPAWNGTLAGTAAINQTNPTCYAFVADSCCNDLSGTFDGSTVCYGEMAKLTFTSIVGVGPYSLTFNDGISNYTQNNIQDGVPFDFPNPIHSKTNFQLLSIKDASNCQSNVSGEFATVNIFAPTLTVINDTNTCPNKSIQLQGNGATVYSWSPAVYLNDQSLPNPIASIDSDTKFYVTAKDLNNCVDVDSVFVAIRPKPVFNQPPDKAVCSGKPISLEGNNPTNYSYSWSPQASLDNPNSPNPIATPDSTMTFTATIAENICNYDSTFKVMVTVNPSPTVIARKSNDIDCNIHPAKISATGASKFVWSPTAGLDYSGKPNPTVSISSTTTYTVEGIDLNGCSAFDSITVNVGVGGNPLFIVPNAFTPNGDGLNDCFGIGRWGNVSVEEFAVYNRWGERIFSTRNPSVCWDGTLNGKAQASGTYVYVIKVQTFCGKIERKGLITLIR